MLEAMVMPGQAALSFGSSSHSGAGAQERTTSVRRRWSKACTWRTACSASASSLRAADTASRPVSFSSMRFLLRVNSGTPKCSSTFFMLRVMDGVEM